MSALSSARAAIALLPCPWCGCADGFESHEGSTFRWKTVECVGCGAGPGEIRKDADAAEAWNTRPAIRALGPEAGEGAVLHNHCQMDWLPKGSHKVFKCRQCGGEVVADYHPVRNCPAARRGCGDAERLDWLLENHANVETDGAGNWRAVLEWTNPETYFPYAKDRRAAIDAALQPAATPENEP